MFRFSSFTAVLESVPSAFAEDAEFVVEEWLAPKSGISASYVCCEGFWFVGISGHSKPCFFPDRQARFCHCWPVGHGANLAEIAAAALIR